MENKKEFTDELNERVKKHMKKFTTEELKKWREELIKAKQMDNELLNLFNVELLDRACERIELENEKRK